MQVNAMNAQAPQFGLNDKQKSNLKKAGVGAAAAGAGLLIGDVPMIPDPALILGGGAYAAEKGGNAFGLSPFTYVKERIKGLFKKNG